MNTLDNLRAEWIDLRKSLSTHIKYLEAGNKIYPIDRDPDSATAALLEKLKRYHSEVELWLTQLPSEGN